MNKPLTHRELLLYAADPYAWVKLQSEDIDKLKSQIPDTNSLRILLRIAKAYVEGWNSRYVREEEEAIKSIEETLENHD